MEPVSPGCGKEEWKKKLLQFEDLSSPPSGGRRSSCRPPSAEKPPLLARASSSNEMEWQRKAETPRGVEGAGDMYRSSSAGARLEMQRKMMRFEDMGKQFQDLVRSMLKKGKGHSDLLEFIGVKDVARVLEALSLGLEPDAVWDDLEMLLLQRMAAYRKIRTEDLIEELRAKRQKEEEERKRREEEEKEKEEQRRREEQAKAEERLQKPPEAETNGRDQEKDVEESQRREAFLQRIMQFESDKRHARWEALRRRQAEQLRKLRLQNAANKETKDVEQLAVAQRELMNKLKEEEDDWLLVEQAKLLLQQEDMPQEAELNGSQGQPGQWFRMWQDRWQPENWNLVGQLRMWRMALRRQEVELPLGEVNGHDWAAVQATADRPRGPLPKEEEEWVLVDHLRRWLLEKEQSENGSSGPGSASNGSDISVEAESQASSGDEVPQRRTLQEPKWIKDDRRNRWMMVRRNLLAEAEQWRLEECQRVETLQTAELHQAEITTMRAELHTVQYEVAQTEDMSMASIETAHIYYHQEETARMLTFEGLDPGPNENVLSIQCPEPDWLGQQRPDEFQAESWRLVGDMHQWRLQQRQQEAELYRQKQEEEEWKRMQAVMQHPPPEYVQREHVEWQLVKQVRNYLRERRASQMSMGDTGGENCQDVASSAASQPRMLQEPQWEHDDHQERWYAVRRRLSFEARQWHLDLQPSGQHLMTGQLEGAQCSLETGAAIQQQLQEEEEDWNRIEQMRCWIQKEQESILKDQEQGIHDPERLRLLQERQEKWEDLRRILVAEAQRLHPCKDNEEEGSMECADCATLQAIPYPEPDWLGQQHPMALGSDWSLVGDMHRWRLQQRLHEAEQLRHQQEEEEWRRLQVIGEHALPENRSYDWLVVEQMRQWHQEQEGQGMSTEEDERKARWQRLRQRLIAQARIWKAEQQCPSGEQADDNEEEVDWALVRRMSLHLAVEGEDKPEVDIQWQELHQDLVAEAWRWRLDQRKRDMEDVAQQLNGKGWKRMQEVLQGQCPATDEDVQVIDQVRRWQKEVAEHGQGEPLQHPFDSESWKLVGDVRHWQLQQRLLEAQTVPGGQTRWLALGHRPPLSQQQREHQDWELVEHMRQWVLQEEQEGSEVASGGTEDPLVTQDIRQLQEPQWQQAERRSRWMALQNALVAEAQQFQELALGNTDTSEPVANGFQQRADFEWRLVQEARTRLQEGGSAIESNADDGDTVGRKFNELTQSLVAEAWQWRFAQRCRELDALVSRKQQERNLHIQSIVDIEGQRDNTVMQGESESYPLCRQRILHQELLAEAFQWHWEDSESLANGPAKTPAGSAQHILVDYLRAWAQNEEKLQEVSDDVAVGQSEQSSSQQRWKQLRRKLLTEIHYRQLEEKHVSNDALADGSPDDSSSQVTQLQVGHPVLVDDQSDVLLQHLRMLLQKEEIFLSKVGVQGEEEANGAQAQSSSTLEVEHPGDLSEESSECQRQWKVLRDDLLAIAKEFHIDEDRQRSGHSLQKESPTCEGDPCSDVERVLCNVGSQCQRDFVEQLRLWIQTEEAFLHQNGPIDSEDMPEPCDSYSDDDDDDDDEPDLPGLQLSFSQERWQRVRQALLREAHKWKSTRHGTLAANELIPANKQSALVEPLQEWLRLEEAALNLESSWVQQEEEGMDQQQQHAAVEAENASQRLDDQEEQIAAQERRLEGEETALTESVGELPHGPHPASVVSNDNSLETLRSEVVNLTTQWLYLSPGTQQWELLPLDAAAALETSTRTNEGCNITINGQSWTACCSEMYVQNAEGKRMPVKRIHGHSTDIASPAPESSSQGTTDATPQAHCARQCQKRHDSQMVIWERFAWAWEELPKGTAQFLETALAANLPVVRLTIDGCPEDIIVELCSMRQVVGTEVYGLRRLLQGDSTAIEHCPGDDVHQCTIHPHQALQPELETTLSAPSTTTITSSTNAAPPSEPSSSGLSNSQACSSEMDLQNEGKLTLRKQTYGNDAASVSLAGELSAQGAADVASQLHSARQWQKRHDSEMVIWERFTWEWEELPKGTSQFLETALAANLPVVQLTIDGCPEDITVELQAMRQVVGSEVYGLRRLMKGESTVAEVNGAQQGQKKHGSRVVTWERFTSTGVWEELPKGTSQFLETALATNLPAVQLTIDGCTEDIVIELQAMRQVVGTTACGLRRMAQGEGPVIEVIPPDLETTISSTSAASSSSTVPPCASPAPDSPNSAGSPCGLPTLSSCQPVAPSCEVDQMHSATIHNGDMSGMQAATVSNEQAALQIHTAIFEQAPPLTQPPTIGRLNLAAMEGTNNFESLRYNLAIVSARGRLRVTDTPRQGPLDATPRLGWLSHRQLPTPKKARKGKRFEMFGENF